MRRGLNLRARQIYDILDEDRNIRKQVLSKEFEQAKYFTETVNPVTQVEQDTKLTVETAVDKFINEAQVGVNDLNEFFDGSFKGSSINDISGGFEYIMYWNAIVNNLEKTGINPNVRLGMSSTVQKISPYVDALYFGYANLSKHILKNMLNSIGVKKLSTRYTQLISSLSGILVAYASVSIIKNRLFTTDYKKIQPIDIDLEYNNIVRTFNDDERQILSQMEMNNIHTKNAVISKDLEKRVDELTDELGRGLTAEEMNDVRKATISQPHLNPLINVADFENDGHVFDIIQKQLNDNKKDDDTDDTDEEDDDTDDTNEEDDEDNKLLPKGTFSKPFPLDQEDEEDEEDKLNPQQLQPSYRRDNDIDPELARKINKINTGIARDNKRLDKKIQEGKEEKKQNELKRIQNAYMKNNQQLPVDADDYYGFDDLSKGEGKRRGRKPKAPVSNNYLDDGNDFMIGQGLVYPINNDEYRFGEFIKDQALKKAKTKKAKW